MKLNLGCSDDYKQGYVNVDRNLSTAAGYTHQYADLTLTWPWSESSIEHIYAKDVFEHIDNLQFPANKGKIWVLNESYRVLKPGGTLEFLVPCVYLRDGRVNPGAFADPTHVSFWTPDDKYYFCTQWNNPRGERGRLGPDYGITCLFDIQAWVLEEYGAAHERRSKIHASMVARK